NTVSFFFEDLDLKGVNDPGVFYESLRIFDANGNKLGGATKSTNAIVTMANATSQVLSLVIPNAGESLWLRLVFKAYGKISGRNTIESMRTTIESTNPVGPPSEVPLPPAIALFGAGLASMGLIGWRKTRRSRSV